MGHWRRSEFSRIPHSLKLSRSSECEARRRWGHAGIELKSLICCGGCNRLIISLKPTDSLKSNLHKLIGDHEGCFHKREGRYKLNRGQNCKDRGRQNVDKGEGVCSARSHVHTYVITREVCVYNSKGESVYLLVVMGLQILYLIQTAALFNELTQSWVITGETQHWVQSVQYHLNDLWTGNGRLWQHRILISWFPNIVGYDVQVVVKLQDWQASSSGSSPKGLRWE